MSLISSIGINKKKKKLTLGGKTKATNKQTINKKSANTLTTTTSKSKAKSLFMS